MKSKRLSLLQTLVLLFCGLFVCTGNTTGQLLPPAPTAEFQAELVNGTGKWSLRFDTIPGYGYSVEESQDMVTWIPAANGAFYGNGSQQSKMGDELNKYQLPNDALAPSLRNATGNLSASGSITKDAAIAGDYYTGHLEAVRVWLVHKPVEQFAVSRTFLESTTSVGPGISGTPQIKPEPVTLTVETGSTQSNPINLEPKPTAVVFDLLLGTASSTITLLPAEVKTETLATQPVARDRKKIGIGKEVKLTLISGKGGKGNVTVQ